MRAGLRYASSLIAGLSSLSPLAAPLASTGQPYAIASRIEAHPYLRMPARPDGPIPKLLSQTGAFKDTPHLVPSDELVPYDLIVPFWSDGAQKSRWIAMPAGKIEFSPTGEWVFPAGTGRGLRSRRVATSAIAVRVCRPPCSHSQTTT